MAAQSTAPVIVKRKKVIAEGGHHGGAWKVAYADFVTAMMAFFMLMWLLGATTEKQRKGIADYFNPTIPVVRASGGGSGAFGGDSVFSEATLAQNGTGAGHGRPTEEHQARGDLGPGAQDADGGIMELERLGRNLSAMGGESMVTELLARHVVTRLSDEGLVIELFDGGGETLFDAEGAPTPLLRDLSRAIVPVLGLAANDVGLRAHLSAAPLVRRDADPWGRSTGRAVALARLLGEAGLSPRRLARIEGHGQASPALRDPTLPRNDRVEIVLLRDRI